MKGQSASQKSQLKDPRLRAIGSDHWLHSAPGFAGEVILSRSSRQNAGWSIWRNALLKDNDVRRSPGDWRQDFFQAWKSGQTGFPMVDACMRCLERHGWVNFRMRAMVVSFAAYNLFLDWRGIAPHLARLFLDYEPGIHYPQLQMQSGVTGINAMRVYNVTKQAHDQDPKGIFIRKYVRELKHVPTKYIHEPAQLQNALFQ